MVKNQVCIYKRWSLERRKVWAGYDKVCWEVDRTPGEGTGQPRRRAEGRASRGGRPRQAPTLRREGASFWGSGEPGGIWFLS